MKILKLTGEVEVVTGLHIGAGDDTMSIGGIDNPVIKDVNTNKPYIPGSSLKGKMRSLLEWSIGVVGIGDGGPFHSKLLQENPIFKNSEEEENRKRKENAEILLKLFGDKEGAFGMTRANFGDCQLIDEGLEVSEAKFENTIDRQKGTALNPRQTERVPAGVKFAYDIRIKVLDDDDEDKFKAMIKKGLELIENDYLGGNGSRGYGRVRFSNKEQWDDITL